MIPLTITHHSHQLTGHLSEVKGAGAMTWHLYVDGFYAGQLFIDAEGKFVFFDQDGYWADVAAQMEEVVIAWYK